MAAPLFLCYDRCGTCRKASKWLAAHGVEVAARDITSDNPTRTELEAWIVRSGLSVRKWFNTSGMLYKEMNLKERVGTAADDELIDLLASNGKLVKRPVLVTDGKVIVGFREEEYEAAF